MARALQTIGYVLGAVTSPIRGLVHMLLGVGFVLAFIGAIGTLLGAGILHLLSPQVSVVPLLRLCALAAVGGAVLLLVCSLPGIRWGRMSDRL